MRELLASCKDRHERLVELWLYPEKDISHDGFVYPMKYERDGYSMGFVSDIEHARNVAYMSFDIEVRIELLRQLSKRASMVNAVIAHLKDTKEREVRAIISHEICETAKRVKATREKRIREGIFV